MRRCSAPLKESASAADKVLVAPREPQPLNTSRLDQVAEAGPTRPDDTYPHERLPLGVMLVEAGLLTQGQVDQALAESAETKERLGEVVVRRGWVSEDDVAMLLAEQWGLNYVASGGIWFESDALSRLSREEARRVEALPTRIQDGHVVVAVAEPTEERLADLRRLIGEDTVVVVVPKSALHTGLQSGLLSDEGEEAAVMPPTPTPAAADEPTELTTALHEAALASVEPRPAELAPPSDSVAALAAQVRGVADSIAALAEYEQRVAQLEAELEARREATKEIRELLVRVVRLLDDSV